MELTGKGVNGGAGRKPEDVTGLASNATGKNCTECIGADLEVNAVRQICNESNRPNGV